MPLVDRLLLIINNGKPHLREGTCVSLTHSTGEDVYCTEPREEAFSFQRPDGQADVQVIMREPRGDIGGCGRCVLPTPSASCDASCDKHEINHGGMVIHVDHTGLCAPQQ